jgi:hypothetical protein
MNIYIWKELPAGIYWSRTDWLISVVGSNDIITIADKNLWATQVYNSWDTFSESNCGKYYQWGNNYGFPFSWSITTSSTQVNAQNYWPWNYYSSSNFITVTSDWKWDSSWNQNLWGDTTNTLVARRWPCAEWYHIPSSTEFENIYTIWTKLEIATTSLYTYLKMWYSWMRFNTTWNVVWQWTYWAYWTSTPNASYLNWAYYADNRSDRAWVENGARRWYWVHIRPFKNEPVTPTSNRTVLYQPS